MKCRQISTLRWKTWISRISSGIWDYSFSPQKMKEISDRATDYNFSWCHNSPQAEFSSTCFNTFRMRLIFHVIATISIHEYVIFSQNVIPEKSNWSFWKSNDLDPDLRRFSRSRFSKKLIATFSRNFYFSLRFLTLFWSIW